jgi:YHS domain-containing protein
LVKSTQAIKINMKNAFSKALLALVSLVGISTAQAAEKAANPGTPKDYPLTKCPVSNEALGEMGKPVKVTHEGTDVYLCCKSCKKDFDKDPAKYAGMVKAAKKQ